MPDHSSEPPRPLTRAEMRAAQAVTTAGDAPAQAAGSAVAGAREAAPDSPIATGIDGRPATGTAIAEASAPSSTPHVPHEPHVPRTDWRLGGRTVLRWREGLLAIALLSLGCGVLAAGAAGTLLPAPWGAASALLVVWIALLVPVVWGFARSRPAGLLRVRAVDLLYGVVLAGLLRLVQGWIEVALGGTGALPSLPTVNGRIDWLTDAAAPVLAAPVVEELFFRAVILVAMYNVLRRPLGRSTAAVTAVVVSAVVFTVVHAMTGAVAVDQIAALALLGAVCGALVMLTGRIWGAVLVHALYNLSYVALALAGTLLA